MIDTKKLFNTIGIDPETMQIKFHYTPKEVMDDEPGKPIFFTGLEISAWPSDEELEDELAFLAKSEKMLCKLRDRLTKEITAIRNFIGWYE
jgi:hypothetical protein